ncbi:GAF and ANTAR domain-containing protein [Amycolatopsis sp. NPDC051371]|uniref:GAF and ANTAR domain-containing protein n=1 Tax=Amycolatopsis sp. NPDC051371 TaxID=3155800 RepID=UPI0034365FDF
MTLAGHNGDPATTAASSAAVREADALQYSLREGPCLTVLAKGSPVRVDDVTTERRWPRWCAAVSGSGLRSVLTTPLLAADGCLGAIKIYATTPRAFGPADEHAMAEFATRATVLVAQAREHERASVLSERFRRTLRDRDTITMARGFLMAREGIDQPTASEWLLLSLARAQGRSPVQTAVGILASGEGAPPA